MKSAYWRRIEGHFNERDPQGIWQGIQHLTNYRGNKDPAPRGISHTLAVELNHFFARCEVDETNSAPALLPSATDKPAFTVNVEDVRKVFCRVNPRKAAGPDNIRGKVLRDCADQLAEIRAGNMHCSKMFQNHHCCTRP